MKEMVKINKIEIKVKEYQGQRVLTFEEIDTVHERPRGTAKRNFNKNIKRFIENEDYFKLTTEDLKALKSEFDSTNFVPSKTNRELILITESGYLMLVKSLNDDLAWEVQRKLVKAYFREKEYVRRQQSNPDWQEARRISKETRREETDVIQQYVEYCEKNGSNRANNYYTHLTNLVNGAAGLDSGKRDEASRETLLLISVLENTVRRTVAEEMGKETDYHEIYSVCRDKVTAMMRYIYMPEQRLLLAT
jgi:hypothetical protein